MSSLALRTPVASDDDGSSGAGGGGGADGAAKRESVAVEVELAMAELYYSRKLHQNRS